MFVAENISKLIKKGIPLNKIYIAGIDDEYEYSMKRIFKEYGIPYFIKNENILYDTVIAKDFFENLNDNIEDTLEYIKTKYNIDNNELNNSIYNKLMSLINKFYWTNSYTEVKELMIEEAKKTTLPSIHFENEIKTTEIINNIFSEDEYIFLMNFNMGKYPSIKKDEDYIDDKIKPEFMDTSKDYNINMKNVLLKVLKSIKNLTISYKNNSITQKYYPSFLIKDNFKEEKIDNKYSEFSENVNKQLFTNLIDNYIKFNEYNDVLPIMNNTYSLDYNTYDNKFTGINTKIENLNYSYSNITEYYKCPFRFLCSKIYKIDEYESTFESFIGSLFHKVLEECIDSNKDVDIVYDEYINEHKNDIEFKNYNNFFIEKLRPEMHTVVDLINKQYEFINKTSESHEAKIEKHASELNLHTKIDAVIKGFVDKILYINDNVIIIDYKTSSSDKIIKERFEYGLNVQLPIYMYLLETINPKLNVAGIYLQKILNLSIKKDKKKSEEELKMENLKLQGLTLNDEKILPEIDSEYESSKIIQSLKVTKTTGELKGQLYSYEDKEDFKQKIKKVITDCINNVYEAKFPINPYKIEKETGCSYCSFKDICYKNENQYKIIKIEKESKEGEQ
jgi:ATP-dependent helicase/DNAse subunit B